MRNRLTLDLPCEEDRHAVTISLKNGNLGIFSPCQFLPETVKKLTGSECLKYSLEQIFELIVDDLKEKIQEIPSDEKEFSVRLGIAIISKGDEYVRYRMIKALGEIGSPSAVGLLVEALKDRYRWVRFAVANALGKIGDEKAVEPLIKALKD